MQPFRVEVIGLGRMGQQHCRVYSSLRRAQLAGVYDAVPDLTENSPAGTRRRRIPASTICFGRWTP